MNGTEERIKFFFEHKTSVYIKTRYKRFYRGLIAKLNKDFLILLDKEVGELPIFFNEIDVIEKMRGEK